MGKYHWYFLSIEMKLFINTDELHNWQDLQRRRYTARERKI
jgi:hypothetical protein